MLSVPWLQLRPEGLYVAPADAYIDPLRPVQNAIITHGHADHARPNHKKVIATPPTLGIMKARYRDAAGAEPTPLDYGQTMELPGGVTLRFAPAGHILGSAQAVIEYQGMRVVAAGDYKRRADPTCAPFEVVPCDIFITEATFGLPVYTHPDAAEETKKLLDSTRLFPDRAHLVGAYGLGKCQRIIALLRREGYNGPIYLHGAMVALCELYEQYGVNLGELKPAADIPKGEAAGAIILCPPSALQEQWSRRFITPAGEPVTAMASGWMRVRARAKQKGVELPLIISDHADWDELLQTIQDVAPKELWITHGAEEALLYWCETRNIPAKALSLHGLEEEDEG